MAAGDRVIRVLDPGPQTTVQDLGRTGQLRYGIPPSGPMGQPAAVGSQPGLSGAQAGAGSDIADPGRQRGLTTAPPATNDSNAPADVNARERQRQDAVIRNQR